MVNISAGGILFNYSNFQEQICTKQAFMQRIAKSKNNELKDLHIKGVHPDNPLDLTGIALEGLTLNNVRVENCDLSGLRLMGVRLQNCDFSGSRHLTENVVALADTLPMLQTPDSRALLTEILALDDAQNRLASASVALDGNGGNDGESFRLFA